MPVWANSILVKNNPIRFFHQTSTTTSSLLRRLHFGKKANKAMWTFSRVVAVVMLLSVMLEAIYCQSPDFTYQEFEREVHRLVNIEREKKGLKPLYFSKHLASCARKHSEDMLQNGYFSHIGKDGSSFSDRAKRENYPYTPKGENIANGYKNPQQVMQGWMDSEGHRNNILSSSSNQIGVGLAGFYWTQVFGTAPLNVCGNGILEKDNNEECDDGNLLENDGCSANCTIEAGFSCTGAPPDAAESAKAGVIVVVLLALIAILL